MMGKETRMAVFFLVAFLWVSGMTGIGHGDSLPQGPFQLAQNRNESTTVVEVERRDRGQQAGKLKMVDLCRRLETSLDRDRLTRGTEVDVYHEGMKPEVTEYRREVHESSVFASPEDERRTLDLCHDLEDSVGGPRRTQ